MESFFQWRFLEKEEFLSKKESLGLGDNEELYSLPILNKLDNYLYHDDEEEKERRRIENSEIYQEIVTLNLQLESEDFKIIVPNYFGYRDQPNSKIFYLKSALEYLFLKFLIHMRTYNVHELLLFHFNAYKGNKYKFLVYVENLIDEFKFKRHYQLNLPPIEKPRIETLTLHDSINSKDNGKRFSLKNLSEAIICINKLKENIGLNSSGEVNKDSEDSAVDTRIQLLIMHYMGMLDNDYGNKTKFSKLISRIINRGENVRGYLTYINGNPKKTDRRYLCKKEENLKVVHKIFIDLGFNELAAKVEKDIRTLE